MRYLEDYCVIDYESVDPYIDRGMGAGGLYSICYPDISDFKIVGACKYRSSYGTYEYMDRLQSHPTFCGTVVGHNLPYDIQCYLADRQYSKDEAVTVLRGWYESGDVLIDTKILAKLLDEHDFQYSLEALAKKYKVALKDTGGLADACWDTGLYAEVHSSEGRQIRSRPKSDAPLLKTAYKHMDRLPPKVVEDYCIADVKATKELYEVLMYKLIREYGEGQLGILIKRFSDLMFCTLEMRIRGVRVNIRHTRENLSELESIYYTKVTEMFELAGRKFNVAATRDVAQVLLENEFDESKMPLSKTGQKSITADWLKEQHHPLCQLIVEVKEIRKCADSFLKKILEIQDHLGIDGNYGRVHPELNILAAVTGRFSCANPNLQQIPKRNPVYYKICRSMFVPEKGMLWVSADYSAQEPVLMTHYGVLLNAPGAEDVAQEMHMPEFDFHSTAAKIAGIERKQAKAIGLGLAYGMGEVKLCHSLGLTTEVREVDWYGKKQMREVAGIDGKSIISQYRECFPMIPYSSKVAAAAMKEKGYLISLGGRHLHVPVIQDGARKKKVYNKAFNALIQGSAADQAIAAMIEAYQARLHLVGAVHDELLFNGICPQSEAMIGAVMREAIPLKVPVGVVVTVGETWYHEKEE